MQRRHFLVTATAAAAIRSSALASPNRYRARGLRRRSWPGPESHQGVSEDCPTPRSQRCATWMNPWSCGA